MKKFIRITELLGLISVLFGFFLLFPTINQLIISIFFNMLDYLIKSYWIARLQKIGLFFIILGFSVSLISYFIHNHGVFIESFIVKIQKIIRIIKTKLFGFIQINTEKPIIEKRNKLHISLIDFGISICFLLIALLFFYNPCQENKQFIGLGGDAAMYTSVAASFDHPELFTNDPVLGDINLHNIYSILQIPLIRFIAYFTGNYGLSFISLIIPPYISSIIRVLFIRTAAIQ